MVTVELTNDEAAVLLRGLHFLLSETRFEVADTDNREFRADLKRERAALESLVAQLEAVAPAI